MRAALVGGDGLALVRGHAEERRRGQDHARRLAFAARAILRLVAFGHRPHVGERTAIVAEIFVDGHLVSSREYFGRDFGVTFLTRFLYANRYPLRLKTLPNGGCGAASTL